MVEIIEDTNGDKFITLSNIDRRMAEEIIVNYSKRGWIVERSAELFNNLFNSDISHVTFTLKLPKIKSLDV